MKYKPRFLEPSETLLKQVEAQKLVLSKVVSNLSQKPFKYSFCGSLERKTFLKKGKKDLDLFMYYLSSEELNEEIMISELKKYFSEVEHVASGFSYYRVKLDSKYHLKADLVPTKVDLEEHYDRTQLHQKYVLSNLTQKLRTQILKLKYLLKKHKLYGAQTLVGGFSGYCVECLLIKYKEIENIPCIYKFPDPTDPLRDLLASVSLQNLRKFHFLIRNNFKREKFVPTRNLYFLENPNLKWVRYLTKNPFVLSFVITKKVVIVELKDVLKELNPLKLPFESLAWETSPYLYFNTSMPIKKYPFEKFLSMHPEFKEVNSLKLQKTYFALK